MGNTEIVLTTRGFLKLSLAQRDWYKSESSLDSDMWIVFT